MSRNVLTDPARSPDKSGGFPTVPPTASDERRESGQGQHDHPTAQWWRVDYWLYAAGGGMTPTWMGLAAVSADNAIAKVRAVQNRRDADRGRAGCGYFKGATATLLPESRR